MPADITAMLDEIRRIAESLPVRHPATLRIGPHVLPILRNCPAPPSLGSSLPLGVPVVLDDDLPPGAWRILDQHGEEMRAGNLWPPHLPVIESDLLPDGVHAFVFTPAGDAPLGPTEPCVIVRAAGLSTNQDRTDSGPTSRCSAVASIDQRTGPGYTEDGGGLLRAGQDWRCWLAPHSGDSHTARPTGGEHFVKFTGSLPADHQSTEEPT